MNTWRLSPALYLAVLSLYLPFTSSLRADGWSTLLYGPHEFAGRASSEVVPESSGVVASRLTPDVYWTHNDSGPYPHRVYAFRLSQEDRQAKVIRELGYIELRGARLVDWEDIAAGPDGSLYLFDGGNNPPCRRADKTIYRFQEPKVDPAGRPIQATAQVQSIRFDYPEPEHPVRAATRPEHRYDSECLMVHPTGDLYIVTKRDNAGAGVARVYKLPAAEIRWDARYIHVLRFVTDLSGRVPQMVTGGDIHPTGRRCVVRNYTTAYEFTLSSGRPFDEVFNQTPQVIPLVGEPLGEGICYSTDGRSLVTTSEAPPLLGRSYTVYFVPWRLANVEVETAAGRATVSWATREPLPSRVRYGVNSLDEGLMESEAPATEHRLQLSGLAGGMTYQFQVASGSAVWPGPTTRPASFTVPASAPVP